MIKLQVQALAVICVLACMLVQCTFSAPGSTRIATVTVQRPMSSLTPLPQTAVKSTVTPESTSFPTVTVPVSTPMTDPTSTPGDSSLQKPSAGQVSFPYGLVYAYPDNVWTEADRPQISQHLEYLRSLGVNTFIQIFSSNLIGTGREQDWLILLDEAEKLNMYVIARLWPTNDWNGRQFQYQTVAPFLDVVQGHPALLAYLGLHEPLERFTSDQLSEFYAEIKNLAPDLLVANYMANMAIFDKSVRFPNRHFAEGICDICIIWYYPARYLNGQPVFEEDLLVETIRENRQLVDDRAPNAQLWFLGQTYTQKAHRRQLRMPTPEEMECIYLLAEREGVDGFLWYPWVHGKSYDQVLSHTDMEPQRQAVRRIYDLYVSD